MASGEYGRISAGKCLGDGTDRTLPSVKHAAPENRTLFWPAAHYYVTLAISHPYQVGLLSSPGHLVPMLELPRRSLPKTQLRSPSRPRGRCWSKQSKYWTSRQSNSRCWSEARQCPSMLVAQIVKGSANTLGGERGDP